MNVIRIRTERGSYIDPPLDETWDDRTKLEWKAALVSHDTGLDVSISDGSYVIADVLQPEYRHCITVPNSSTGPHTFHTAWTLLTGINMGAEAVRREAAS